MKIQIRGANRFEVTDAIKNYIEDKVGSLQRFLPTNQNLEARVYIKIYDVIQKLRLLFQVITLSYVQRKRVMIYTQQLI